MEPTDIDVDLPNWAAANGSFIESQLGRYGAILFRGFHVETTGDFQRLVQSAAGEPMRYSERTSPRTQVAERIYTSTDYPPEESIFPHNEHSYARVFPLKLFFFAEVPPVEGGRTPIGDTRRVLARIDPEIRQRFVEKGWMYVRNFGTGLGLSWQTVFQTADKSMVQEYCRSADIESEWKQDDQLRTRQVRPAIAHHPKTGEPVWFNHIAFFHISTLPQGIRDSLRSEYSESDLPNNTYYGDGSRIEDSVMEHVRQAYLDEAVSFAWRQGDVLLVDNMLTFHSRTAFSGERRILVAMAEPHARS